MKLLHGCGSLSGVIVRFNKKMYGLKQASRQQVVPSFGGAVRLLGFCSVFGGCMCLSFGGGRKSGHHNSASTSRRRIGSRGIEEM